LILSNNSVYMTQMSKYGPYNKNVVFTDNWYISHLLLFVVMPTVSTNYHSTWSIEVHVPVIWIHPITVVAVGNTPLINTAASEIKSPVLTFIVMVASDSSKEIIDLAAEVHGLVEIINVAGIVTAGVRTILWLAVPAIYSVFLAVVVVAPHSIHRLSTGTSEAVIFIILVTILGTDLCYVQHQQDNHQQQQPARTISRWRLPCQYYLSISSKW